MWANAQRDGRPAEHRCRPLFNAAKWLTLTTILLCSKAAKTRMPLKFVGVLQTGKPVSAASGPKFTILCGHVEDIFTFIYIFTSLYFHWQLTEVRAPGTTAPLIHLLISPELYIVCLFASFASHLHFPPVLIYSLTYVFFSEQTRSIYGRPM